MRKFLKIFGITFASILLLLYLIFLFVLPNVVDLNQYKPMVQQIVKEQAKLDIDFSDIKIDTTAWLEAGIKLNELNIKFLDGSEFVSIETIKTRISLPALLGLTVRVSTADVYSPKVNLDIVNGEQYKIVRLVETIVNANARKNDFSKVSSSPVQNKTFNPALIKVIVPDFSVYDYQLIINDYKNRQNMTAQGNKVTLGYFNGKKAKVEADAKLLVDGKNKINADFSIDTFIPKPVQALDEEDDPTQRLDIPFVNPIDIYKTYDFKSDIFAKVKVRERDGDINLFGVANIENMTMNLSGYQLPKSYMKYKFVGNKIFLDTDLYVTPEQHFQALGKVKYGKKPFVDIDLKTTKIYFNDLILLAKATLDTFNIQNNLDNIIGKGYFEADTRVKTNFKRQKSEGYIAIKDGGVAHRLAGLLIKDAVLDISLDNNMLDIKQAYANINGAQLKAHGRIDKNSVADIQIETKALSLKEIYNAFAPKSLKQQFILDSAIASMNVKIQGKLEKARAFINVALKKLVLRETKNTFAISNEEFDVRIDTQFPALDGVLVNKNFRFDIPSTSSSVYFPFVVVNMDEKDIAIIRSGFRINNNSVINFNGNILNYLQNPYIDFNVDGRLAASDLKTLIGKQVAFYVDGKGVIPLRTSINGTLKKLEIVSQIMSDAENYFSPVIFDLLKDKQSIFQFRADYKGNRIKIKDTGIYTRNNPLQFSGIMEENMLNTTPIAVLTSTITKLDSEPYINLLKISIPKVLKGSIYALENSEFKLDRTMLFAFGEAFAPRLRGVLRIFDVNIPTLFTTLGETKLDLQTRHMRFNANDVLVNDSDFKIDGNVNLNALPLLDVTHLNVTSEKVDVNKLLEVAEAVAKLTPPQGTVSSVKTSAPLDIPLILETGRINFKYIDAAPVVATDTTGHIWVRDNVFHLDELRTHSLEGQITGQVMMNLLNSILTVQVHGEKFNVEEALLVLANMKDSLSGTASFDTDITLNAAAPTQAEQMRSIKGNVNFEIKKGQLGPFGRIENLILSENIRNSKFFETAIGSVVHSLTTIETSHFDLMNGHISFNEGVVDINPITTLGNVLCTHIAGNMNLLTNDADMTLRARMGSQFSNMLGPLAAVNPVNLIKVTPGLNVMAAKAFQFFCESITQEEMDLLPDFSKDFSVLSTTKFQVILSGNLSKPLSMFKSFKWLALDSEIEAAQNFVSTLPDPSLVENPETATYEQILAAQEAKAKEDAKLVNRVKRFLGGNDNQ